VGYRSLKRPVPPPYHPPAQYHPLALSAGYMCRGKPSLIRASGGCPDLAFECLPPLGPPTWSDIPLCPYLPFLSALDAQDAPRAQNALIALSALHIALIPPAAASGVIWAGQALRVALRGLSWTLSIRPGQWVLPGGTSEVLVGGTDLTSCPGPASTTWHNRALLSTGGSHGHWTHRGDR
jgi:hypothetical protein